MKMKRRNVATNSRFPQYTTDYISGVMSLRKPQEQSLKILEEIISTVNVKKGMNLKASLHEVHALYPTCSDFERDFMSLTFVLATGVGKTRLMGHLLPIFSVLFEGIKKGVFTSTKFDSLPELVLARVLEQDKDVINWLRPAQSEFNITYNRGRHYVLDFVVETDEKIYLIEVKGEDKLNDADVIAKGKMAVKYCEVVSNFAKANGRK